MAAEREVGTDPWTEAETDAAPADAKAGGAAGARPDALAARGDDEAAGGEVEEGEVEGGDVEAGDVDAGGVEGADVAGADVEDGESARDAGADAAAAESDGLDDATLLRALSALVLAAPEPLTTGRLAALVGEPSLQRVRTALEAFGERLSDGGLGVELREIAGGWRLVTDPAMSELVGQMFSTRKTDRISPAGLETLAIVAYRQPVTKAEIEAIRGVQAGPILRTLVDRGLVRVAGRAEQPGAPLLYGTTRQFLDRFGLARLEDLPRDGELARD